MWCYLNLEYYGISRLSIVLTLIQLMVSSLWPTGLFLSIFMREGSQKQHVHIVSGVYPALS